MPSKLYETTMKFSKSYDPFTIDNILSIRTDECTQSYVPMPPGQKPWTKKEMLSFYKPLEASLLRAEWEITRYVEDAERNTTDTWINMTVHFKPEAKIEPYQGTYVIGLTMNEDQTKVTKFIEHVDTRSTPLLFAKMCEGQKNVGAPQPELPFSAPPITEAWKD